MAEALGVAASAISILTLTAQIIDSIDKLRALHTFIKTASVEFEDLIGEIEIIQAVLRTLTPEMLALLNLPSAERRLQVFHQDLEILILKVSKYKSTAGKRLGAVKLVLKRETFRTQRQSLDNLKSTPSLLQLACYHASLSRPSQKSMSAQTQTIPKEDDFSVKWSGKQMVVDDRTRGTKRNTDFAQLCTSWIRLWTITTTNEQAWKFTMQVNNIIPYNSPVIRHCRNGEVGEVQKLFSAEKASPFDCLPNGTTLLHIAARYGDLEMCHFLLDNGADIEHRNDLGRDPICYLNGLTSYQSRHGINIPFICDLYRVFISVANNTVLDDGVYGLDFTPYFSGPPPALSLIQNHWFERYSEMPLRFRFGRTMGLNTSRHLSLDPAVFQVAMGGDVIDPAAYMMEDIHGQTLLHKIAEAMGCNWGTYGTVKQWRQLLSDAVSAHADLNKPSQWYTGWMTPLTKYIFSCAYTRALDERFTLDLNYALQLWLSELQMAGVDLVRYGEQEFSSVRGSMVHFHLPVFAKWERPAGRYMDSIRPLYTLVAKILGVQYGPEPKDWHIWMTNPIDELVGEFWEMVERGLEVMPGTWID
ncbi:hypothetical protein BJY01DRAFT_256185 [Aspergillus pseudoustus]|uniref:Ankyrin repeat-containing domain protein n=1 Tax=Aspergillus pseudoustus TaxID=1810923 RepID=A0ABR4ID71_9EURO